MTITTWILIVAGAVLVAQSDSGGYERAGAIIWIVGITAQVVVGTLFLSKKSKRFLLNPIRAAALVQGQLEALSKMLLGERRR